MNVRNSLAAASLALLMGAAQAIEVMVPAYFYPSADPAQSFWDEMTAAAAQGARITAIVNPNNGPGDSANADYSAAINTFRAAGGRVLGYVYTCYGRDLCVTGLPSTRSAQEVLADAQRYEQWYGVDGIFLDEMSNRVDELAFYTAVAQGLRSTNSGWQIVGNPGVATPAEYLNVADTLVTFEGPSDRYAGHTREAWMDSASPQRQAHLLYNVASSADMQQLVQQAAAYNAGYVYITNDRYVPGSSTEPNPWDQLPSYWAAEVAAVSAVPEPGAAALLLMGAALLLPVLRRR